MADTPLALKGGGFSVHRPSQRQDSPKALSAPLDVSGRVLVAVEDQSAVRADVRAHRERLVDALPTPATVLRSERRTDRFRSLTGACCLVREDREKVASSGVLNACIEARLLAGPVLEIATIPLPVWLGCRTTAQVGRLDRLEIDRVVLTYQGECHLMMEVGTLPPHVLLLLGEQLDRLLAAGAPLLPLGYSPLGFLQLALRFAIVARVGDRFALSGDEKHLQPDINARLLPSEGQRLRGDVGTGEGDVPAIRLLGDRDRLGRPFKGAGPPSRNASDLAQDEIAVIQADAVAILDKCERMVAVLALKTREAGPLAMCHPTEEGLIRLVQSGQHVLEHVAVDASILRHVRPDVLQFSGLLIARNGHAALFPHGDAGVTSRVMERATAPQDALQLSLLCGRGSQLFLVGFAASGRFHATLFQSCGTKPVMVRGFWLKPPEARLTARVKTLRFAAAYFYQRNDFSQGCFSFYI